MYDIEQYCEAATVQEAVNILLANPDWRIIAGGTDILIKMHQGKIERAQLLGIGRIKSLKAIKCYEDGTIGIGSLATFQDVVNNPIIKENLFILAEAAATVGGPQIRAVATIGGNICNGVPSADSAPALFTLKALLKLQTKTGERIVPVEQFYLGPGLVDLNPGEILEEIMIIPDNYKGFGGNYIKFATRKAMDIATLSVAVNCRLDCKGVFTAVRIGLGVAGPTPIRCFEAEEFAIGNEPSTEIITKICKLV